MIECAIPDTRKVFEDGFRSALEQLGVRPTTDREVEHINSMLQHAWKSYCGEKS